MTRLRKVIAARMVESLQVSAQLTTVVEVDVTKVARLRDRAKRDFEAREGVKLSFLPFFALAAVEALKAHPSVNSSVNGDEVTYHGAENLGVAVDTERGLLVPVIKDAGDLNIAGLARKIADLAERTRTNKVSPDELGGGTFTLTNTGSRGALFDTPIINQPNVAILGTGAVVKRPVVVKDADGGETIAIRSMVYLALSYDHRVVDGADAARFLVDDEDPARGGRLRGLARSLTLHEKAAHVTARRHHRCLRPDRRRAVGTPDGSRRRGAAPRPPRAAHRRARSAGTRPGVSSTRRRWTASTPWSTSPAPAWATTGGRPAYKQQILASRVDGTHTRRLGPGRAGRPRAAAGAGQRVGDRHLRPDRGDEVLTEDSPAGHGFLCDVVRAWEAASKPAEDAGLRVVHARTGLVLSPARRGDGAGAAPGPARAWPARWGRAVSTGAGSRLQDEVRALAWAIDQPSLSGHGQPDRTAAAAADRGHQGRGLRARPAGAAARARRWR